MRRLTFLAFAAMLLFAAFLAAPAHAGCGVSRSASGAFTITTTAEGACDTEALRSGIVQAVLVSEGAGYARGGERQGALANQQRTTSSNLYKLGTAPGVTAPPTRLVMPVTR